MPTTTINLTIQLRRGSSWEWDAVDPVLAPGEPGVELDTGKFKIGNGVDVWTALSYNADAALVQALIDQALTDAGTASVIRGSATYIGITNVVDPGINDIWIQTDTAFGGVPGDGRRWDGTSWLNVGQIQGPAGLTGDKGDTGAVGADGENSPTITILGSDTWANIDAISNPVYNGMWIQTTNGGGGLVGDGRLWEGFTWLNVGPIRGPEGPEGGEGAEGPQGETGGAGSIGPEGPAGSTGGSGPQGLPGIQGIPGDTGPEGIEGPTGPGGAEGPAGPDGPPGPDGSIILGSDTYLNITTQGTPVLNGVWVQTDDDGGGFAGDGLVWNGAIWTNVGQIRGPQGLTGVTGDAGNNGTNGIDGINGTNGTDGTNGIDGVDGDNGSGTYVANSDWVEADGVPVGTAAGTLIFKRRAVT